MPNIQYIGRKSVDFFGKYLSEIAKNLKNRGKGRIVVKEIELKQFVEPCYYVLDRVVPLMSDPTNVRCRAWGQRVFRGRDLGYMLIPNTHEPDWRLLSPTEAENIINTKMESNSVAPDVPVTCIAPMPPLLSLFLSRSDRIPQEVLKNSQKSTESLSMNDWMKEASGLLLLTPHEYDPTKFQVAIEPTEEEKSRIYPPYDWAAKDGLIVKKKLDSNTYLIRRSDTPGLYWRVHLAPQSSPNNLDTEQLKSKSSTELPNCS